MFTTCYLWTRRHDWLVLELNSSATKCSWTVRYVTALTVFQSFTSVIRTICKQHFNVLRILIVFSYIFLLYSPQAIEWQLERYHFCGECSSWSSSADKLFLEQNASTTMRLCSWTFLFNWFTSVVTTVCKQQPCWKLKTFHMSSFNI